MYVFPFLDRGDSSWSKHDGDEGAGSQTGTAGERQTYARKRSLLETKAVFNFQSIWQRASIKVSSMLRFSARIILISTSRTFLADLGRAFLLWARPEKLRVTLHACCRFTALYVLIITHQYKTYFMAKRESVPHWTHPQ